jgi:hypothetical protein
MSTWSSLRPVAKFGSFLLWMFLPLWLHHKIGKTKKPCMYSDQHDFGEIPILQVYLEHGVAVSIYY